MGQILSTNDIKPREFPKTNKRPIAEVPPMITTSNVREIKSNGAPAVPKRKGAPKAK